MNSVNRPVTSPLASPHPRGAILALSGGVGGAKLAAGLAMVLPPERLSIVVNTGDDFEHLGLTICPDIDSVVYAMAGLHDPVRGWGVADESWRALAQLGMLGEADWFALGDRDLAMHIARSHRLRAGETLSAVTARLAGMLGVRAAVIPMSDAALRTRILTDQGWRDFQHWFVAERCEPVAHDIRFIGAGVPMAPDFADLLHRDDLAAVIICPSNPFLSVDPILAVAGVREGLMALGRRGIPCLAVSPLIGGRAVKGPLGKLLAERGGDGGNAAIAGHYGTLISHMVIDAQDQGDADALRQQGLCVTITATLMHDAEAQADLARNVLAALAVEMV